jgi:hypothetical protein
MPQNQYADGAEYDLGGGNTRFWYQSADEKRQKSRFVTEDEWRALKAGEKQRGANIDADAFREAQVGLRNVDRAAQMLDSAPDKFTGYRAALDAGEIKPSTFEGLFRSPDGKPGTPGWQMREALAPVKSRVFLDTLNKIKAQSPNGGGVGVANSEAEGRRLENAFGSLSLGQDPQTLRENLRTIRQVASQWAPGLTQDNPMDLTGGQSRDAAPREAFYRSPDGAVRRNVNGDAGNPIVWTPGDDPQKSRKDAKLAWNDRWYQKRGNLDGADAAFNQWWASYSGSQKKAPPIAPPPRANSGWGKATVTD